MATTVSVIIPCLNEEAAIGECVTRARQSLLAAGYTPEIVVIDNGCTDRTAERAAQAGAQVVDCPARGYGAALAFGVHASRGEILVFGDGDGSYDFAAASAFADPIVAGYDMVLGTRFHGSSPGPAAMPFLHRTIGNPLFTRLINLIYGAAYRDVQCGLRSFSRGAFSRLRLDAPGFEYAVEIVIEAARRGLAVTQVPIVYHPTHPMRRSKVRMVRDGFRVLGMIVGKRRRGDSSTAGEPRVAAVRLPKGPMSEQSG